MSSGIVGTSAIGALVVGSPNAYASSGTVVSPALTIDHTNTGIISWDEKRNFGSITCEYATSTDGTTYSAWTSVANGGTIPGDVYLKYQFTLTRGGDQYSTPELMEVRISYTIEYFDSGTWVSPAMDLRGIVESGATISWTVNLPSGTSAVVETRSGKDLNYMGAWQSIATSGGAIPSTDWFVQCRITLQTNVGTKNQKPSADSVSMTATQNGLQGVWYSPTIDASTATDKASGTESIQVIVGSGRVEVWSRSSADSTAWSDWYASNSGALVHPANSYVQVAANVEKDAELQQMVISFDGAPNATSLASDFSSSGNFYFSTLLDYAIIVNGVDAPRKYDGTTLSALAGSPPRGGYIQTHKNRLWTAGDASQPSRLYFSDILNIESWPALNFIDISPNDGDKITGLLTIGDYLVISKGHSMWMLTGEGTSTFSVRRIHSDKGAYAPRSLILVDGTLCFVSDDGIYFSDFSQAILISERIRSFWRGLNLRRINQAASWHYEHKLYVSVPSANSIRNDVVIVFDMLRKTFVGIYRGWNVSCWASLREGGRISSMFGHSDTTQVSELIRDYNDNNQSYTMKWKSKEYNFGSPESYKRFNRIFAEIKPALYDAALTLTFFIDGQQIGSMTVDVASTQLDIVQTARILASRAGVVGGRTMQLQIEQVVKDNPLGIHLISIENITKGLKPTIYD